MKREFVITAVGKDRPGIVAGVTEVLFKLGGNIEDSSMTILAGEFAMIIIVSLPQKVDLGYLEEKLDPVRRSLSLVLSIKELGPDELRRAKGERETKYMISVLGVDRPGIVYRVTEILAEHGINITDVQTQMAGEKDQPIYTMVIEVEVPKALDMKAVSGELEERGRELKIDVSVRPIDEPIL